MSAATCIDILLKDRDREIMRDRRLAERKWFVRPVEIALGPGRREIYSGYSRDISHAGIGIITECQVSEQTRARVTVHLCSKKKVSFEAEARWVQPFGDNWYITGWKVVS